MISAIVAINNDWGIGYNGQLLEHISEDLKHFQELTTNNVVIMGRKTWDSLPNKPLKYRLNIVLTREPSKFQAPVNTVAMTLDDFLLYKDNLNETMSKYDKDIFIIGGDSIYHSLLQFCDRVYVTKIYKTHKSVDTYFPNLDNMENWNLAYQSKILTYNNLQYQFLTYDRIN